MLQNRLPSMPAHLVHTIRVNFQPEISGQSLAKGHRSPRELAVLAARWLAGALVVKPTVSQASMLFGVCPALIRDELRWRGATLTAKPPIETIWADMSAAERDGFESKHQSEMWAVFNRVTAP